jgi:nucleotide-binding universal stress UspA family protein
MYRHVLIPTDGSALSEMAIRQGIAFAKSLPARVTAMTVSLPFHAFAVDPVMLTDTPEQYERDCKARAEKYLGVATAEAAVARIPCETVHVWAAHPYEAIIDTARKAGCDLIFMASHGRKGVSALVLGSETVKVLTHSKIPVLVCR